MVKNFSNSDKSGTPAKVWQSVYSHANLTSIGVPAFSFSDAENGVFRDLLLDWDDITQRSGAGQAQPYHVVCCDVLQINGDISLDRDTYVYARRIEIGEKAHLTVDRIDDPGVSFTLVTQEIVTPDNNEVCSLPFTVLYMDAADEPAVIEDNILAFYRSRGAWALELAKGENELKPVSPAAAADTFLLQGEQLPLCLNTQFIIASLHFTQSPEFVLPILAWISELLVGSRTFSELSAQSRSFYDTVYQMVSLEQNTLLVPHLDHSVYASTARDCLAYLESREQRYREQQTVTLQNKNWEESVRLSLEDKKKDVSLNGRLEEQARLTRDQTAEARSMVMRQLVEESVRMEGRRIVFERGIANWKEGKIRDAVFEIVSNSLAILFEVPTIVAAGPVGVATTLSSVGEVIEGISDMARALTSSTPKELSLDRDAVDQARNHHPVIRAEDTDSWSSDSWSGFDDPYGEESDFSLNLDSSSQDDFWSESVDDLIDSFLTVEEDPEAKAWLKSQKAFADQAKKTKKDRAEKQKKLMASLKTVGGKTKNIVSAAMNINKICAVAESMEASSRQILTEIESGVDVALGSIAPVGIDVVTGGAEKWDILALEIESTFETLGEEVNAIRGGNDYRKGFRKLLILGQAMSQARLALAKANSDLAAATLRRMSAQKSVDLFQERLNKLRDAVLKDEVLQQITFQRVLETKRSVFLSLEAYRRALIYFTLAGDDKIPALPKMTDTVEQFSKSITSLVGKELVSTTLSSTAGVPSTMNGIEILIDDPEILTALGNGETASVSVPIGRPEFKKLNRVRIKSMEVYLEGLQASGPVDVHISSSGVYQDQMNKNQGYDGVHFIARTSRKLFVYETGGRNEPLIKADRADRFENDFFKPTPFSMWSIRVESRIGAALDFSNVTAVRMVFFGEVSI